jgi:hypothetical protein
MARKIVWDVRILLPLTTAILKHIDAARSKDETRVDLIRDAIERELNRRERKADIKKRL